jgi:hypothetical protein
MLCIVRSSQGILERHSRPLRARGKNAYWLPLTIRLRCVTQPDQLQSMLLDRLGIIIPKRLRIEDFELSAALTA